MSSKLITHWTVTINYTDKSKRSAKGIVSIRDLEKYLLKIEATKTVDNVDLTPHFDTEDEVKETTRDKIISAFNLI